MSVLSITSAMATHAALAMSIPAGEAPLLDGRCDERAWIDATTLATDGVFQLKAMSAGNYLYLCLDYPEGSFGMADLHILPPGHSSALTLHASAKLGERALGAEGWTWWNNRGWTATLTLFDGMSQGRPDYRATPQREWQIALSRFGRGDWKIMAAVYRDDAPGEILLPVGSIPTESSSWLNIHIP